MESYFRPENLYDLKPMEVCCINEMESVMRVPGGWIISMSKGTCFVPFNKEFQSAEQRYEEGKKWNP